MTKTPMNYIAAASHGRVLLGTEETRRALSELSDQRLADIGVDAAEVRNGASMTVAAGLMPNLMSLQ